MLNVERLQNQVFGRDVASEFPKRYEENATHVFCIAYELSIDVLSALRPLFIGSLL